MSAEQPSLPVKPMRFDPETDAKIRKLYPNLKDGLMYAEPGGHVTYPKMWVGAQEMYNFQVRSDDVWLLGFPKSGTNWLQEIAWQVNHNCDFEKGKQKPIILRIPTFELSYVPLEIPASGRQDNSNSKLILSIDDLRAMASPRHLKTHLPLHLLPPNLLDTSKVIYIARNPKDVIVSYYFYHELVKLYKFNGSVEEFAESFMKNQIARSPFFPHVIEAWNKRNHPNMHFVFYEDLKSDLRGEIEKLAKFLGRDLTDEQIQALIEHASFENCKKSPHINAQESFKNSGLLNNDIEFYRNGKTGDWKSHFSPEMNERLDAWIRQNLANTDLDFRMELSKQE